jgi:hypothetical protein
MILASTDYSCFLGQILLPLLHIKDNNFTEGFRTTSPARRSYLKLETVGKQKVSTIQQSITGLDAPLVIPAASPVVYIPQHEISTANNRIQPRTTFTRQTHM